MDIFKNTFLIVHLWTTVSDKVSVKAKLKNSLFLYYNKFFLEFFPRISELKLFRKLMKILGRNTERMPRTKIVFIKKSKQLGMCNKMFLLTYVMPLFFLYPLKTSENLWFSHVFRGCRKRPVAWNELTGNTKKQYPEVFCKKIFLKIHRKTPVPESLL